MGYLGKRGNFVRVRLLGIVLLVGSMLTGCGSSDRDIYSRGSGQAPGPGNNQVVLRFDDVGLPAGVDSIQAVFLDGSGNRVGDVAEVPLSGTDFVIDNVPSNAVSLEIDYLRNEGFALFESYHALGTTTTLGQQDRLSSTDAPRLFEAKPGKTVWTTSLAPARFNLEAYGNPGNDIEPIGPSPFAVRGVGYSPTPIGASNKDGPNFGDVFWDGFYIAGERTDLLDWQKVWKRDLENIRTRFNSVRLYALVAEHVDSSGRFTNPPQDRDHKKFLDACWNNGHNPVYVMVGVPMPSDCFLLSGNADNRANWERVYAKTLQQTKDHPAVMGYTFFNEIGGLEQWGEDTAESDFYWGQIQKYADQGKAAAPDKLIGFAYFDAPPNARAAKSYMAQYGGSIDYWGINSFQGSVIGPTLAPYKELESATKPVLFTEFGVPATGHSVDAISSGNKPTQEGVNSIYADATTISNAATAMSRMIPVALADNIVAGMFYFEWCDEHWKQDPSPGNYTTGITTHEGGVKVDPTQMPNGFYDEEGFGLHAVATHPDRPATSVYSPFNKTAKTANNFPDILTPRQALLDAVTSAFAPVR